MQIVGEFNHNLVEVCHFKIGIQLPKLWNLEGQFLEPILLPIAITKSNT